MQKLNEVAIESLLLEHLANAGYETTSGKDLECKSNDWLLKGAFKESVRKINFTDSTSHLHTLNLNYETQERLLDEALNKLKALENLPLLEANEQCTAYLTQGITLEVLCEGQMRGVLLHLLDFTNPQNNTFLACNQLHFNAKLPKRPDVVLFINGFPVVVCELKNPLSENATLQNAYNQLQTYKAQIPALFIPNVLCMVSDGLNSKVGSVSADYERFMQWRNEDKSYTQMLDVLKLHNLLEFTRFFVLFEKESFYDKSGLSTTQINKKIAAYHQYYAVQKAIESAKSAMCGDKRGGVVWHTQGSGKSLTMVFFSAKAIAHFANPTLLIITDRNDLDEQLFSTFAKAKELLRTEPTFATSTQDLKAKLKRASGGIIFSTIQKFRSESATFECLSNRENILVLCDEAHRSQYGFEARLDEEAQLRYGYAKYLRDALPNATYLGFSGTPIEKADADTRRVFGEYIDIYDIARAVEDNATLPIFYESRLAKIALSAEGQRILSELDSKLIPSEEQEKINAKATRLCEIIGAKERLRAVAKDILEHFTQRQEILRGKAMIVCMSREIAVSLYEQIVHLKPSWHSEEHTQGKIKVIITANSDDGEKISKHHTSKAQRSEIAKRFKSIDDELEMVIVCDMWLTGFDVPPLHTLYMDKFLSGHNLMQAIARVNHVYKDKPAGLVVDYLGIANELKTALEFYTQSGGRGEFVQNKAKIIEKMQENYEITAQMLQGMDYLRYFAFKAQDKLKFIAQVLECILAQENGKKRFLDNVTRLLKSYAIALPCVEADRIAKDMAFFDLIKRTLKKYERSGEEQILTSQGAIKQIINDAIISEGVVNLLDNAGIQKPNLSILSEEFLNELANHQHKNLTLQTLQKLLNDELSARLNSALSAKSLIERLQKTMRKYQNNLISVVEAIEELIVLSKELIASDTQRKDLGLKDYEYAFYEAIAQNESAKELMQQQELKALAIAIFETLKKNITLDWQHKESVRAKLRVAVKKVLKAYGYPPDMQKLAVDRVIAQAELVAGNLV
ncbi:type I restriction endonuclease subunit R [Campylobacter sp. MIT 21-1685]|uniref:type I restriction endonuclease subunit R n=1 Tax=unclassified Campylobacter TaxID=2593542 RepID=UPI00224A50ED|nr:MULTISPECIES: type I restriction endonuclease subunit R [unclassified Campylobacter]MCX2683763.1 type I restriction endonuclease subunit R [Campylobacter sp. MIT 21-1684]MCX2752047.1 type I restriction endonuclease subunit R [Campylobacter sp. MIT 21-1682]MCX2808227.1 type I restriction endonuclease subunit R [Campylobacter sp. MIT 21-1685]